MSALTRSPAWQALQAHQHALARHHLREWFAADPARAQRFTLSAAGITADFSKHRTDGRALDLLHALARQQDVEGWRDRMLRGDAVNATETRAALHTALRRAPSTPLRVAGEDVMPPIAEVLARMRAFCTAVRSGERTGHTGARFTDVVNLGIGGSDLGPAMVTEALAPYGSPALRVHYVSNVDAADLAPRLARLDASTTLFVICSKTFTTIETMTNAASARDWLVGALGAPEAVGAHFVAVSTNLEATRAFGIAPDNVFGFRDWVGGRYSLWSAIGLPIAIAIGSANFRALLAGAHAMDRHFAQAPLAQNLPVLLGLLDVWYINFHGYASRSVAPYHQGLARLPAYLQQLEMESTGKRVDLAGRALPFATSPVVWGEPGTNGQHAYFQMLHQGTEVIPVEFILVKTPSHALPGQHAKLLANGLAQSQALMLGKSAAEAAAESVPTADAGFDRAVLAQHRSFPGNRPSTSFVLDALTPSSLGAFLALYEHRVWTSGALWGINSFDQWGVELGKALAGRLLPRLQDGPERGRTDGLDASTAALLQRLTGARA